MAEHAKVDELASPRHEHQRARQQVRLHVALDEEAVDAGQPFAVEAERGRPGEGERRGHESVTPAVRVIR